VDIATTLVSIAGGKMTSAPKLPGKDITTLLNDPEKAKEDALRIGSLFNYNMFAYIDQAFFSAIGKYFAEGGTPDDIGNQGFRPNLKKRGAIRSIFDGQYKFSRYFSPLEHHVPRTIELLFASNDLELFDLKSDPHEMKNLAVNRSKYGALLIMMNDKLNLLIEQEVGLDAGQMLPELDGANWELSPSIADIRL
jgi:arylsulfatase